MSWNFHEVTRVGAESALDACDYFVDEVIEPWKVLGKVGVSRMEIEENFVGIDFNKFSFTFTCRFSRANSSDETQ